MLLARSIRSLRTCLPALQHIRQFHAKNIKANHTDVFSDEQLAEPEEVSHQLEKSTTDKLRNLNNVSDQELMSALRVIGPQAKFQKQHSHIS